jgi:hypothetical protein
MNTEVAFCLPRGAAPLASCLPFGRRPARDDGRPAWRCGGAVLKDPLRNGGPGSCGRHLGRDSCREGFVKKLLFDLAALPFLAEVALAAEPLE